MRRTSRSTLSLLFLAAIFALLPVAARAQAQDPDSDPPSRVGRLNYTQGSVSYQVQGDQDWVAADPNRPLTTGDNLWADKDSRGEVHIDSTAVRLSSETGLSFLNLDDRTVQLQLPQGEIEVHLRQLAAGDAFEIDTPNLAFTLTRPGEYVISTDPNGTSTNIVVREGEGQVTGGGDSWNLEAGQQYHFAGTDQLSYQADRSPEFGDFESWCESRDQRENASVSARYVSRDVDGYYDLDDYGDWSADSDYGQVWYPRNVAAEWVPYHVGHWVYIAPWGWTWVDEEPWGFAPFHYGRWVIVGSRWGWVPGPVVERPVYAPALVGFVGGGGFSLSVSIGGGFTGVAWFPLGPRDVFVPAYHCSPHYVDVVNVTNTRVIKVTEVRTVYNTVVINHDVTRVNYTYVNNVHAVTAVSRETFVNARPVARDSVHINESDIRNVRVVSNTAIAPTRASYVASTARVSSARPAVPFSQRPVVANLPPRVPVHQQQGNNNNGFHGFGQQGGQQNGQQGGQQRNQQNGVNAGNNGHVQPPPTNNAMPAPNNGGRGFDGRPQASQAPNVNAAPANNRPANNNAPPSIQGHPQTTQAPSMSAAPANGGSPNNNPPHAVEQQGGNTPQNNQPAGNSGFRSFGPNGGNRGGSNSGGASNSGSSSNGGSNGNNSAQPNNNPDRYRFNPPTKAKDDNYDVHPPLNQNNGGGNNGGAQPRAQHEEHQAPRTNSNPPKDNGNKDNKKN
jgi:hypothetical protein